jgi:hypothetical protein
MQAFQLLTAAAGDELTASFASTSVLNGVRTEHGSQLQFDVDYTPHASNLASATCYAEWELLYTKQNGAPADALGAPESLTWKSYVVESDVAVGSGVFASEFFIKRWRAYANDTDGADRDPTFSVPIGFRRVKLQVREVGAGGNFGTFKAAVGHQPI